MRAYSLCGLLALTTYVNAAVLVIPEKGNKVGKPEYGYSQVGETIDEVGARFDIGYQEMVKANPQVNPVYPLEPHTKLLIPSKFTLPNAPRKGIVINLSEYRLYYFPKDENVVITFPIGIGREGWDTPTGVTKVIGKNSNPEWHPSEKLQAAAEELGAPIPEMIPPGEHNPLGKQVLRLGWPSILIHGSNRRDGIGTKVSAGCIRLFNEDMEQLFELVSVGTEVRVINSSFNVASPVSGED